MLLVFISQVIASCLRYQLVKGISNKDDQLVTVADVAGETVAMNDIYRIFFILFGVFCSF
jgi:hypothetical protein